VLDLAGGKLAHALVANPEQTLLLANSGGYGFVCQARDLEARSKAGKQFIGLEADETLLLPICLRPEHTLVAVLSKAGRLHVFDLKEVKTLHSGGRGVQLLALQTEDTLLSCVALAAGQNLILQGLSKTGKPKQQVLGLEQLAHLKGPRGRKGKEHGVGFTVCCLA
jgi:topoisomerase-4 subunit A